MAFAYSSNILKEFPGVTSVSEVPFHKYKSNQHGFHGSEDDSKRVLHRSPLTAAVDLTSASVGVIATIDGFHFNQMVLRDFFVRYNSASVTTTAAQFSLRILRPSQTSGSGNTLDAQWQAIKGGGAVTFWAPNGTQPLAVVEGGKTARSITKWSFGAYNEIPQTPRVPDYLNGSILYPIIEEGDVIEVMLTVQGVGTQNVTFGVLFEEKLPQRALVTKTPLNSGSPPIATFP